MKTYYITGEVDPSEGIYTTREVEAPDMDTAIKIATQHCQEHFGRFRFSSGYTLALAG